MPAPHGAQPRPPDPLARIRRHPHTRAIARAWRTLTGLRTTPDSDRTTIVACSGGADSTALLLALAAAARRHIVAAHILHDLRPAPEAHADLHAVQALADRLGIPFLSTPITVRDLPGNTEAAARRARYHALAELARKAHCPFVAVAHQGDDLVETLLMRLLRGSGPRGLAVLRDRRPLAPGIDLIRPMLTLTAAHARALCRAADIPWQEDATNADTSRWRARLRRDVLPVLADIRPDAHARFHTAARLLHDAASLTEHQAAHVLDQAAATPTSLRWGRRTLATLSPLVLGATLRLAHARLVGPHRLDRLDDRAVRAIHRALHDPDRRPRAWTIAALRIESTREELTITAAPSPPPP